MDAKTVKTIKIQKNILKIIKQAHQAIMEADQAIKKFKANR